MAQYGKNLWWFLPFCSTSACNSTLSLWDAPSPAKQVRACSSPSSLHEVRRKIICNHYLLYSSLPRSLGQRPYFALSKVHFLLFGCTGHTDCPHCYWDKNYWAKYCWDKSPACHALLEVLCWDHQAKAGTQRFPSISDSIPHSLHDLGQIACNLTCRSPCANQVTVFQLPSGKESKHCLNICQGQSSIVPQAGPMALHQEADAPLQGSSPESLQPRFPTPSSAGRCLSHQAWDEAGIQWGQQTSVHNFKLISALCWRCLFPCL